jgi:hypothetical protein
MPNYTRRRRGGGLFDMFSGKKNNRAQQIANLEAQKTAAMKKSKSRVANVLSAPGTVTYTNKARIAGEFDAKIKDLMSQIENPQQTASALNTVANSVENALKSQSARQGGAIVITIPVFAAQLFLKAARLFLAIMVFFFGLAPAMFGAESAVSELVRMVAPNMAFNTTKAAYSKAKQFTGVRNNGTVVENY